MDAPAAPTVDPASEAARQAAEAAGLPPWAVVLVTLLAPLAIMAVREWLARRDRKALAAVIAGVDAAANTLGTRQANAVRRAIAGEASSGGVGEHLDRRVSQTRKQTEAANRAKRDAPQNGASPGPGPGA